MFKKFLFLVATSISPLWCQSPPATPPPTGPTPAPTEPASKRKAYVRRFSFGGTFSYAPFGLISNEDIKQTLTGMDGYVSTGSSVTNHRAGGGVTVQFGISERFTLDFNVLYRATGYSATYNYTVGYQAPTSSTNTQHNFTTQDTASAKYWDFPLLMRLYLGGRHDQHNHYFLEAGPSLRLIHSARLTEDITDPKGNLTTTDSAYMMRHRNVPGFTVGLGRQFIDPFGIRVVPELRFTQWLYGTFSTVPIRTTHSQAELMVSLTF